MRLNKHQIFILALVIFSIIAYNFVNLSVSKRVPFSPDENSALFISKQIVESGTFFWSSSFNEEYNVSIFRSRGLAEVSQNTYSMYGSIGFTFLLSIMRLFGILSIIISIISILGILGTYVLVSNIYNQNTGLIAAVLYSIFPTTIFFSNSYFDMVPAMTFFIFSTVYFFKFMDTHLSKYLVITSLFFCFSVFIRWQMGLFIIPLIVVLILNYDKIRLRHATTAVCSFIVFIAPLLFLNKIAYNGYFTVGQDFIYGNSGSGNSIITTIVTRVPIDINVLKASFGVYLVEYLSVIGIFFFGLLGILHTVVVVSAKQNSNQKKDFLIFWILIFALIMLFFGSRGGTYGFELMSPAASMARYFMPIYLMFTIYCAYFISEIIGQGKVNNVIKILIMTSIIVSAILFAFSPTTPDSVSRLSLVINENAEINHVINELPKDSIVLTKRWEKFIFPDRITAIIFTDKDVSQDPDLAKALPIVRLEDDILPLIQKLLDNNKNLYITRDLEELIKMLKESGYSVVAVDPNEYIWEVEMPKPVEFLVMS